MNKSTLIRNISLLAILIGFFLPWLDLGEMGELMSGFAAMAGEKIPSTLSGFQLDSDGPGGSFGDGPSPALYGVIPFALIAAFYNKTWTAIVCTILAIGIIVLFAPTVNEMGKAAGASGWGIGKVITMIGFVVIVLTRVSGGVEDTA